MTEEEEPLGEDVEGQSEALKKRNSLTGAWKKSFKAAKVQVARVRMQFPPKNLPARARERESP